MASLRLTRLRLAVEKPTTEAARALFIVHKDGLAAGPLGRLRNLEPYLEPTLLSRL